MGRGVGAVFRTQTGEKYSVERDGIVNVKTKVGDKEIEYTNLRLIGMNVDSSAIRAVMEEGGITEIMLSTIVAVTDAGKGQFSCVKKV